MPSNAPRNRPAGRPDGPSGVQRSYASQLREQDALFHSYEHLQGLPRGDAALTMLRKVASLVKPIMRKRGWKVAILAEFLPPEHNLLGLNINRGYKICVRLRYHNSRDLFLPIEQVVDTMLHELSHIVWGEHDANFHRLWDELRDEQETLFRKGYTGEGFLSEGKKLGGGHVPPPHEMRRLARASAEKRQAQSKLQKNSGQRLGGTPLHVRGRDIRTVIADQVTRRNAVDRGCASGRQDSGALSDQAGQNSFRTKAEEDDANDRAIAQALYELMEEEEERKLKGAFSAAPTDGGLAWHPENGLYDPGDAQATPSMDSQNNNLSEEEQMAWALQASLRSMSNLRTHPVVPHNRPPLDRVKSTPIPTCHDPDSPLSPAESTLSPRARTSSVIDSPISPLETPTHPAAARSQIFSLNNVFKQPTSLREDPNASREPTVDTPSESGAGIASPTIPIDISDPFDPTISTSQSQAFDQWTCEICTCINPLQFLACDACGTERPETVQFPRVGRRRPRVQQGQPRPSAVLRPARVTMSPAMENKPGAQSLGWVCTACGAFMEHRWWTCSACGRMKESS